MQVHARLLMMADRHSQQSVNALRHRRLSMFYQGLPMATDGGWQTIDSGCWRCFYRWPKTIETFSSSMSRTHLVPQAHILELIPLSLFADNNHDQPHEESFRVLCSVLDA